MGAITKTLDFTGGCVDSVFLLLPRVLKPFTKKRDLDRVTYQAQLDYYFDEGFVDDPRSFFTMPEETPNDYEISSRPFRDGFREIITWDSKYRARNPLVRFKYRSFAANRTAHMVRWTHGDQDRKTVVCLHGYMLGEPKQAEKMFKVRKLYDMGLDVALVIAPFHWRRAPEGPGSANIAMQPDDVVMTCEFFGQAMYDICSAGLVLKDLGAGEAGLIGASMGGYHAALFSCLSNAYSFAAMMVPGLNLSKPIGPEKVSLPFKADPEMMKKISKVWQLHTPLNMEPVIPQDRILIIASRGDRLCPFEHVEQLCKKWPGIRRRFMTGGHWLVFNGGARGKSWYSFLVDMGF